jgi:hypothetical protein
MRISRRPHSRHLFDRSPHSGSGHVLHASFHHTRRTGQNNLHYPFLDLFVGGVKAYASIDGRLSAKAAAMR